MHRGFGLVMGPGPGHSSGGKIAGLYDLEETLGSGHFAVVKLARHVFTGEKVAVKVIDKTKLDEVSRAHLFQEVRCMKLVQHPNVVRLYEVIDTQTKLYLILELGDGGDLYDYIMKHDTGLSEELARDYFRQIVRAISYCHRLHVVHRDLKPENVVFFEKLGIVKLTDFGFSNKFCPGQKLETSCGSLAYSAPEILLGDSYDAPAVDVWSLGVILYMLVCGHAPFQEANDSETLTMIMDCKYIIPQHVSPECKALIGRMLVRQPDKRATLSQIASDPWVCNTSLSDTVDSIEESNEDNLPLVSRQHLNEEDHALIIQKMVNGQIATKDQILEALDKNEYNHMTATYYLLAERKLRLQRQDKSIAKRPEVLSVTNYVQNENSEASSEDVKGNRLLLPSQQRPGALLTVPRTPGDIPQRARKCSIVREEEDDEDSSSGRRGSRSEGRLHLALQERLPAALESVGGVTNEKPNNITTSVHKLSLEDENTRKRLGNSGMGTTVGWMPSFTKKNTLSEHGRPKSAIETTLSGNNGSAMFSIPKIVKTPASFNRSDDKSVLPLLSEDDLSSIVIKEASTISIPICSPNNRTDHSLFQTFKSMPSPVKLVQNQDVPKTSEHHVKNANHRRAKYHRNLKTTSCSSSDASDEESENHKKRPPKHLNTPTHKPLSQRRDSHDDSSDSQEQGAVGGGGSGSSSAQSKCVSNSSNNNNVDCDKDNKGGGNNGGSLNRKHRGGRRSCETRLRESQSLNRITEVHEADMVSGLPEQKSKKFFNSSKFLQGFGKRQNRINGENDKSSKIIKDAKEKSNIDNLLTSLNSNRAASEEKENCQKLITASEKNSFKKMRLLTRYFQVHKKLCLPRMPTFSGLSNRNGRLYKAQSCGSIVRDKITSAGASSLLLVNELCKDKPIVLDSHRARIKLIADMNPQISDAEKTMHLNSIANNLSVCKVHLGDASKCCGLC